LLFAVYAYLVIPKKKYFHGNEICIILCRVKIGFDCDKTFMIFKKILNVKIVVPCCSWNSASLIESHLIVFEKI
jgi:hypothetical protein